MKYDLVIDARMITHSGIGTYLQNLLPGIVPYFRSALMAPPEKLASFSWTQKTAIIPLKASIYDPKEHWQLFRKTPPTRLFWSPHFNAPLLPVPAKQRLVTIHDVFHMAHKHLFPWYQRGYAYILLKNAVQRSQHILTVSYFSQAEIHRWLRVPKEKITVIHNGIDHSHFKPLPAGACETTRLQYQLPQHFFLFVGNLKPHKNLSGLLKAFHRIAPKLPEWHLVVLGKIEGFVTPDATSQALLQQLPGISSRVHFLGSVPYTLLPHFYNLASIFVFPSYYEGFGLPPLEAMACGCPVVASNAASITEVCQDAALYFDPHSTEEMARQLLTLATSPHLQRSFKEKGKKHASMFTWEKTQHITRSLIAQLLADR